MREARPAPRRRSVGASIPMISWRRFLGCRQHEEELDPAVSLPTLGGAVALSGMFRAVAPEPQLVGGHPVFHEIAPHRLGATAAQAGIERLRGRVIRMTVDRHHL